jgi:tRNA(Ile)-lysidine synthase
MRKSPLLTSVEQALRGFGTPSAGEKVVMGLSGGADSVALLHALRTLAPTLGFEIVAAHLDHRLRAESAEDAAFCAEVCGRLGVTLRTGASDVRAHAARNAGGLEEAARHERYAFLRSVKEREGAVAIAVAHTRDDQAETFLMRLLRGSGSVGLAAMRPRAGDLIRPLFGMSRLDVLQYMKKNDLVWREDPTNTDPAFLRNRVRHELLPYLEARFNPAIRETLVRTARLTADEADVLDERAEALWVRAGRAEGHGQSLDRAALLEAPRAVARLAVRRALAESGGLRGVAATHVEKILGVASSKAASGRRLPLPGERDVVFRFDRIWVVPRTPPAQPFAYALPVPGRIELPGGLTVVARNARRRLASKEMGEWSAIVETPETAGLVVRSRRPGDRVRAHGREMSLKRFLMAERVPADLRGRLPLVASGATVLWVPGLSAAGAPGGGARLVRLALLGPGLSAAGRGKAARP